MNSKNWQKVGKLDDKSVYYSKRDGFAIKEDHQYLREMSKEEIGDFMAQKLEVLGEYDYSLSKKR